MTKPTLPPAQRRVPISVSLPPWAVAALDRWLASGKATSRSGATEYAILYTACSEAARRGDGYREAQVKRASILLSGQPRDPMTLAEMREVLEEQPDAPPKRKAR